MPDEPEQAARAGGTAAAARAGPLPAPPGAVRRRLAWALGALLLLRVAAGLAVAALSPSFPALYDGEDYRDLAASVSAGHGLSISRVRWFEAPRPERPTPEAFRPPLLPLLAGWLVRVRPDSYARLLVFQGVLATLVAGTVAFLLLDVAGPRAAWVGLALASLHPLLLVYSTYFSTEILFSLCLALFVWSWMRQGRWRWPAVGCAIALAVLARPTAMLLLPLSLAAILRAEPRSRRLLATGLVGAGFLLLMGPWMLRNQALFGETRVTGYFGGYNFWLGNSRLSLEGYEAGRGAGLLGRQAMAMLRDTRLAREMREPRYSHPREQEAYWAGLALADIRGYGGGRWLGLLAAKAWHFWRPWPLPAAHGRAAFWIVALHEIALFALGGLGLARLLRRRCPVVTPLLLLLVAGTLAHSLTVVHLRHRVPFVDLALIVCAGALARAEEDRGAA